MRLLTLPLQKGPFGWVGGAWHQVMGSQSVIVSCCSVSTTGQQEEDEGQVLSASGLMQRGVKTLNGVHICTYRHTDNTEKELCPQGKYLYMCKSADHYLHVTNSCSI